MTNVPGIIAAIESRFARKRASTKEFDFKYILKRKIVKDFKMLKLFRSSGILELFHSTAEDFVLNNRSKREYDLFKKMFFNEKFSDIFVKFMFMTRINVRESSFTEIKCLFALFENKATDCTRLISPQTANAGC